MRHRQSRQSIVLQRLRRPSARSRTFRACAPGELRAVAPRAATRGRSLAASRRRRDGRHPACGEEWILASTGPAGSRHEHRIHRVVHVCHARGFRAVAAKRGRRGAVAGKAGRPKRVDAARGTFYAIVATGLGLCTRTRAAPAPARAEAPARDAQDTASERANAQARRPSVEARSKVRTPGYAPSDQADDLPAGAFQRPQDPAAKWNDPGPPVAIGPGPQYESARTASRLADDPGPPVVPGPGPLYTSPRVPAATPAGPRDDPGPPITIGPGPLVDYSVRGVRPR